VAGAARRRGETEARGTAAGRELPCFAFGGEPLRRAASDRAALEWKNT